MLKGVNQGFPIDTASLDYGKVPSGLGELPLAQTHQPQSALGSVGVFLLRLEVTLINLKSGTLLA